MFGLGNRQPSRSDSGRPPGRRGPFSLSSLYTRGAASGKEAHQGSSSSISTTSSNAGDGASGSRVPFAMPGNIRRIGAQPTVEVARPAPDVEITRVSDSIRPVFSKLGLLPTESSSLRSLRSSQQQPGFSPSSSLGTRNRASSNSSGSKHGAAGTSSQGSSNRHTTQTPVGGSRSKGHSSHGIDSNLHATRPNGTDSGSGSGGYYSDLASGGFDSDRGGFTYFNDEMDVPFRSNAVEIAAQDDKNECAFLSHEPGTIGGDFERARSILPQLVGQLHPATAFSSGLPSSGRELGMPATSMGLYDELDFIYDFNQGARSRLKNVDPLGVLSQFAIRHLQVIIRQLLDEIGAGVERGWDQVVFEVALSAVKNVRPNVRGGDSMDMRRYVRIKRIPGGKPQDSQYISGIVFTKNLAHRRMPRVLESPRIMLLAFPLDHAAPSKYISFDDELRVQQGFAEKLVQRIVGAAPDLVLVEKSVPRRILESLMRNKIAVAYGVKRSVLRAIARCTGAEIVTSMDRFSDYPRTGVCRTLVVQTYEDASLPEFRKSFIFLDGCIDELGGTIVLRGEPFDRLEDIKQVVDLVVCLTYSLYLEAALLVNEFALAAPGKYDHLLWAGSAAAANHAAMPGGGSGEKGKLAAESLASQALSEYNVVLSSSPCVRIPPPHVLVCMRERELAIRAITEKFNRLSSARKELPSGNDESISAISSVSTGVAFLVSRQQSAASSNRMRQQYESEIALHESYVHEGENFLDANPQAVSLWDYQSIVVAYMVTCRKHEYMVCAGPQYHSISFYGHTDVTLGQYLEEMCFDLNYDCPSNNRQCTHPMYEHRRSYIHNEGKIDVTMDEYPCPIERLSEVILMWGSCKVCKRSTPVARMSEESWRYSFGKYLETTFYNEKLRPRALICSHDMHRDYVRCFALRNMVVKFEYSSFPLWSIVAPTIPLYFNMEVSIRLKEKEAAELRAKLDDYYESLLNCLESFPMDLVYEDKADQCRHVLNSLSTRAATEQVYFQQTLEQTIRISHPADTLVIAVVYEALQSKVVEWNLQFSELAQTFIQLDASNRMSTMRRITSNDGLGSISGAGGIDSAVGHTGTSTHHAGYHAIDSLEIIDELHSAADHNYTPNDPSALDGAPFQMPPLGSSPSDTPSITLASDAKPQGQQQQSPKLSRLHRSLSMKMMKQERERLERQQERLRRAAETSSVKSRQAKYVQKSEQPIHQSIPQQQQQRLTKLPQQGISAALAAKQPENSVEGGGYSTARLIGRITADTDDPVRVARHTEFPELKGRRAKAKGKYSSYSSQGVAPILDILNSSTLASIEQHSTGVAAEQAKDKTPATAPSRIPGYRSQQQQQQQQQQQRSTASGTQVAGTRPLSSFGKPPNARNSNIPRPPNIRGRPTSPVRHDPRASAPGSGRQTDSEDHKGSSNVFLRLAKRLNSAKGAHNASAMLGTVPRKMNLLLPAAAQYMSQHPKRPAMSQVQVFYTKPFSEGDSRKQTPARRHSYQPSGNAPPLDPENAAVATQNSSQLSRSQAASVNAPMDVPSSAAQEPASESLSSPRRHVSALSSRSQTGTQRKASGPGSNERQQPIRNRSATVARVQSRHQSHSARTTQHPSGLVPARPATTVSTGAHSKQAGVQAARLEKTSAASRASSIIPSITRRLGLGFGFRGSPSRAPSESRESAAGLATDDDSAPSDPQSSGHRQSSASRSAHDRRLIPPPIDVNLGSRDLPGYRSSSSRRGTLRGKEPDEAGIEIADSYSSSDSEDAASIGISIDSTSDSDSGVDDHIRYGHEHDLHASGRGTSASKSSRGGNAYSPTAAGASSRDPFASQADFIMNSPVRTARRPSSLALTQLSSLAADSDGEARAGDIRDMLESNPQPTARSHRDSSTEDDDVGTHEPDLHFGESDAGSDIDNIAGVSEQDAENAAAYLESVMASSGAATGATPAARGPMYSQEPTNTSLTKVSSIESKLDTANGSSSGGGSGSGSGDSTAVPPLHQENITTLWKTISNLLLAPGNSQLFQIGLDLKYPLDPTEHVMAGSLVIVREAEPSSIIAFTMMASEYRKELQAIFETAKNEASDPEYNYAHDSVDDPSKGSPSTFGDLPETKQPRNEFVKPSQGENDEAVIERVMLHSPGHHLRFQFTAGRTRFVCKVFYAAQFDALRRCNGCEDNYIESLSRCAPYLAKGGKSGSGFLKTHDERFIIKQVSKAEMEAFLKFAPFYFEHMYRTYKDVMLTVLAKIFGFCRVSYRNASTGKSLKMNVVIMENLHYQRRCSRVFDLKGSERNRMVQETSSDAVFQDENLIRFIRENPICIRQQTKRHLHDAIWNDTLFLSKMNVMDYSLLVGFDENSRELVVGIVDFIRTFTWDKKLESWVKEAGILGGGGKGPTIVSPKQYKNRFREAMERYFLMIPDKFFVQPADDED
ncbi:hypothetical protein GQ54DRAFT_296012 [Martensiomyces pterosporus]|nr:hypothetical protein GQ54DRAFT_296012 [Martensiomyces pterosporus]